VSYYSFFPKSENPIKPVMRHLPHNTPAEDISDVLVSLGFDVVSVKQMTANRHSPPEESKIINLPLFLVTLSRTAKSQEIFRLSRFRTFLSGWRLIEPSATTASSLAMFGQTASSLPAASGAEAIIYTKIAARKEIHLPPQHAATVGWRKEKTPIPQIIEIADTRRMRCRRRIRRGHLELEGVLFQPHHFRHILRSGAPRKDRRTAAASDTSGGRSRRNGTQGPCGFNPTRTAKSRSVISGLKYKQFVFGQNVESSINGSTADNDRV
jgi:hypothetical protein